jgi:hypothetical protein
MWAMPQKQFITLWYLDIYIYIYTTFICGRAAVKHMKKQHNPKVDE